MYCVHLSASDLLMCKLEDKLKQHILSFQKMLQYHGKPWDLNSKASTSSSSAHRRGTVALILPQRAKQTRPSNESTRFKTLLRREEKVQINVSGKRYHLTPRQLQKFPKSLLGDPAKRGLYYDAENEEIFFDRNQTAFECVFNFYATQGKLIFPKRTLSGQLIADELYYFGVYDYLSLDDKKYNLPTPRRFQGKRHVIPRWTLQKTIWETCEVPHASNFARVSNLFSLFVIMFAVILACMETLPTVRNSWNSRNIDRNSSMIYSKQNDTTSYNGTNATRYFILKAEQFCIIWFTVELSIRFIVAPEKRKFLSKVLNIIDIMVIIPYYILLFASSRYRLPIFVLKLLRLSRIFQVLKISRFTSLMKLIGKTIKACIYDLWTMVFLTFTGTVLFGSTVYYCEQSDQDTVFHSIPDAFWWAVVTISTVGYGDMVPTTIGKSGCADIDTLKY